MIKIYLIIGSIICIGYLVLSIICSLLPLNVFTREKNINNKKALDELTDDLSSSGLSLLIVSTITACIVFIIFYPIFLIKWPFIDR